MSLNVHANSCGTEKLTATYQVSFVQGHDKTSVTKTVNVYRIGQKIAYDYVDEGFVEVWSSTSNGQVQLTKLFPQYKRGIEYQSADLIKPVMWESKYHIIAPSTLQSLQNKSESHGEGCKQTQEYEVVGNDQLLALSWMPNISLPSLLAFMNTKGDKMTWQLESLSFEQAILDDQFKQWDSYYLTDYTDIGDNEQDPFLAKMIYQGFSPQHDHHH